MQKKTARRIIFLAMHDDWRADYDYVVIFIFVISSNYRYVSFSFGADGREEACCIRLLFSVLFSSISVHCSVLLHLFRASFRFNFQYNRIFKITFIAINAMHTHLFIFFLSFARLLPFLFRDERYLLNDTILRKTSNFDVHLVHFLLLPCCRMVFFVAHPHFSLRCFRIVITKEFSSYFACFAKHNFDYLLSLWTSENIC